MIKVFCSGSCRLLTCIGTGYEKILPIHSMIDNFYGKNFLGKLHNTRQHIQFIKFIKNEIEIPDDILPKFLTSYNYPGLPNSYGSCEDLSLIPYKLENIKNDFDNCEWYIFEICSIKLYRQQDFEIQHELINNEEIYFEHIQTETELLEDLREIRNIINKDKKILFQVHFRPNIFYNDENLSIENRELIYKVIKGFCEVTENTFLYDPSIIINPYLDLNTAVHFNNSGYEKSFNYILENYLEREQYQRNI